MNDQLLQIPATLSKTETMSNRSLRLRIDTQENLSDEKMMKIVANSEKLGWFSFLAGEKMIDAEDVKDLPDITDETDVKTPSQRFRGVLYRVWESKGGAYKAKFPFEVWYRATMEQLIDVWKEKIA